MGCRCTPLGVACILEHLDRVRPGLGRRPDSIPRGDVSGAGLHPWRAARRTTPGGGMRSTNPAPSGVVGTTAAAEEGLATVPVDATATLPASERLPRLLLAEDDDDVRWCLSTVFELDGFQVIAVSNGVELLDELYATLLHGHPWSAPDVIVTDLRMPGFHVLNLIEGIRAAGIQIPVVMISAWGDEALQKRLDALDVSFFGKPLDLDALERAVLSAVHPGGPPLAH